MRADRLVSLMLLLHTRGRTTAQALADALEVSVRTIYRDIEALSAAGVPVYAESGAGGGCQLIDGYRSPFQSLSADEAQTLELLGVPEVLSDLSEHAVAPGASDALVHLDLPRWFHARDATPYLPALAEALKTNRQADVGYGRKRTVDPLGLVNKAGVWYLVAGPGPKVFRVGRVTSVNIRTQKSLRPKGFDLPKFWRAWSEEFEATRSRVKVTVKASRDGMYAVPEIFGFTPDAEVFTLTFEHEAAAASRLAGLGDVIEVLTPDSVKREVVAIARRTLERYGAAT
jgi:predicted DNA-binding transcriptional regulator YafY